ncbi:hypothetical protein DYBT9623_00194 [Dyadobacter sp. CECT 9623]|uniref:RNA polymerase sigma-70 factor n=1 Tax=Dyadobacter linearis TaxID=2823330 RepID=A0ABM8UJB7_9BACT|nr:RNA polymerase sigma-70 factor [Dyadobacter sp. CECT 9623]CAG5067473.1 hypothetical protein DYBT9623_00194 [Dyadobacter sp. CECT 9623]
MQYSELDDHVLIRLITLDDKDAFQQIYVRYWSRIFALVRNKLRSHENAAEIVQDIFLDVWERRETLEIASVDRYLFTAAKYKILNHLRRNLDKPQYWDQSLEDISSHIDQRADNNIELEDLHNALENALATLPAKTRKIFRMNRLENQSVQEISVSLDIPKRTIEYHLTQSIRKLRLHLREFVSYSIVLVAGLF